MKQRTILTLLAVSIAAVASIAPVKAKATPRRYLVLSRSDSSVPDSVFTQIQKAGAKIRKNLAPIGMVAVTSDDPQFASKVPDALAVMPDLRVNTGRPKIVQGPDLSAAGRVPGPPNAVDDDPYLNLQWGITAVDAQNSWKQGRRGKGAIIAVLDEGVDATHPDLAPNVRKDLSTSFAEDCSGNIENWQPDPGFYFNHGTHVAGIAAAADNAFGVIGVAPQAQIMAVDVLSRCLGYGLDSWILDGIRYAADHGADVINMSLGGLLNVNGGCDDSGNCYTAADVRMTVKAYTNAAAYARRRGVTVIASSGNDGVNFDAEPDMINLPSDAPGILAISAVAPIGWGVHPKTSLFAPAYYANFGKGRIALAGPGGTDEYYDTAPSAVCTVAGVTNYCFVFDYVFSDIPGGYSWAAGTSMAAPHASGVAAQYIGAAGGSLSPVAVELLLRTLANRPTGKLLDPFYGSGVVDTTLIDAPY